MAGAELLGLQHPFDGRIARITERGAHLLGAMAVHHGDSARRQCSRRLQNVRKQRPAGERMQHLRQVRAHPLAQACRENDDFERHPA
jgi:hypothetical protein